MSPAFDPRVMCLYCGALVCIEDAAEDKHGCRPAGALGPFLAPTWRPVRTVLARGVTTGEEPGT